ncbi:MAG: YdcF family protein [Deltaproteobacteria bacterium]|nr:YdcF family protein [Deltaproteobacteria bacterium]
MRPRFIYPLLAAVILSIAGFLYLLADYAASGPESGASVAAGRADAIVVLTGGRGRAEEGIKLLRSGAGDILILSGVDRAASVDSIFAASKLSAEIRGRIILEKNSTSTHLNAVEVGKLMNERGLKSMVLVTSGYHLKRARTIFDRVMPSDVSIIYRRVATPNYDENDIWNLDALLLTSSEFLKYWWFKIFETRQLTSNFASNAVKSWPHKSC